MSALEERDSLREAAGPPSWDRASWDAYKAVTGKYPYSAFELPASMSGAPEWAYVLMNLRPPPVGFRDVG